MAEFDRLLQDAIALHRSGRLEDAEPLYRQALALDPGHADLLHLLGVLLAQRGATAAEGIALIRRAIAQRPDAPAFHNNLGKALADQGLWSEAVECHRRATVLEPRYVEAHYNLGVALARAGKPAEAEAAYRRALELAPDDKRARTNLGAVLQDLGRRDEAAAAFKEVLAASPDDHEALVNLAGLERLRGNAPEARALYRRAIAARPDSAKAHFGLGLLSLAVADIDGADAALRRVLDIEPDHALALLSHASVRLAFDDFPEAWRHYDRLMRLDPTDVPARRDRLLATTYDPRADGAQRWREHRDFGQAMQTRVKQRLTPLIDDHRPDRRLRIGWLSSDFRAHSVGRNVQPFFAHRDRERFETVCYAQANSPDDAMTTWFRRDSDRWRPIAGLDDEQVAHLIRDDRIDVMIYLAGRFDANRPQVAAWRPAPVQVSFLDAATSGLDDMDYLIADRWMVPRHAQERFAERVLRPPGFYVHQPLPDTPEPGPPPTRSADVCFASFHHPAKLNDRTLALWAQILDRLPGARLWFKYRGWFASARLQDRIRQQFSASQRERLRFDAAETPLGRHLDLYREADIALDPFPFNGSTSTFEALWMGVPVITCLGTTLMSRWTGSMLRSVSLEELIADRSEAYVETAIALARDYERRAALRAGLRGRLAASALCDSPRRTRQFERLLRVIWRRWCATHALRHQN